MPIPVIAFRGDRLTVCSGCTNCTIAIRTLAPSVAHLGPETHVASSHATGEGLSVHFHPVGGPDMLYMVELRYEREQRDAALRYFWTHGQTNYEGKVTVQNAWIATQDLVAYALVDALDSKEIEKACLPLNEFGTVSYRHVTSVDEM